MSQISLGFWELGMAYFRAKNSSYSSEALELNQAMQEIFIREYESTKDVDEKIRKKNQLLRLQESELGDLFKLNFPEEK